MGTCILLIAPEFDGLSWVIHIIEPMQQSRMGVYVHFGRKDCAIFLREASARKIGSCLPPAGNIDREGQMIQFLRVFPPPRPLCCRHVVFNTPYVVHDYPEFGPPTLAIST